MTLKRFFNKHAAYARDNFIYKAIFSCYMFSTKMKAKLAKHIEFLADQFCRISFIKIFLGGWWEGVCLTQLLDKE